MHLVTEASNTGWGAKLEDELISGLWNTSQKKWHIHKKTVCCLQNFAQRPDRTTEQKYPYTMRQQNGSGVHKETCRREFDYGDTQEYRHTNRTYSRS